MHDIWLYASQFLALVESLKVLERTLEHGAFKLLLVHCLIVAWIHNSISVPRSHVYHAYRTVYQQLPTTIPVKHAAYFNKLQFYSLCTVLVPVIHHFSSLSLLVAVASRCKSVTHRSLPSTVDSNSHCSIQERQSSRIDHYIIFHKLNITFFVIQSF